MLGISICPSTSGSGIGIFLAGISLNADRFTSSLMILRIVDSFSLIFDSPVDNYNAAGEIDGREIAAKKQPRVLQGPGPEDTLGEGAAFQAPEQDALG